VTLTDEGGKKPVASLSDGTEVAILGWRPGWAGAARYHVRATESADEGWLGVANIRRTDAAPAAPTAAPTTAPAPVPHPESERRFGRRN
jgi:hypothetical protein